MTASASWPALVASEDQVSSSQPEVRYEAAAATVPSEQL